ncbi:hypothetical protein RRG08_024708 [Elysia crispata]|uniref:Uncharacterized protein n=1 Tax=Elysia crispata TaxID=231223 RepID=A0AAE0YDZ7_9GAST|nr:hypothetical protein RRG08_024708 [Elysia crispata]
MLINITLAAAPNRECSVASQSTGSLGLRVGASKSSSSLSLEINLEVYLGCLYHRDWLSKQSATGISSNYTPAIQVFWRRNVMVRDCALRIMKRSGFLFPVISSGSSTQIHEKVLHSRLPLSLADEAVDLDWLYPQAA